MANLITFIRLALVFLIVAITLYASALWQLLNPLLVVVAILLDGLDGVIARVRREVSVFGSVFDIAADRITEFVLWAILAKFGMVSIWVVVIIITRGVLVDNLRKPQTDQGKLPFGIMHTAFGKFLVAGRTMRFASGFFKLITFSWLFFLIPAASLWPQMLADYDILFTIISNMLVYITVFICLARGIPVMLEVLSCKN
jgi:CDP-diacylglycerol---glycerol-3-phosphate 3-phosphatidyltransferase